MPWIEGIFLSKIIYKEIFPHTFFSLKKNHWKYFFCGEGEGDEMVKAVCG